MTATKEQKKYVDPPPASAAHAAVADLVWSRGAAHDVFAVVQQPAHARFLSEQCRLVGVSIESEAAVATSPNGGGGDASGDANARAAAAAGGGGGGGDGGNHDESSLLRLRLEEIYVGIFHGFLTLQRPGHGSGRDNSTLDVDAFCEELMAAVSRDSGSAPAAPSTPTQRQRRIALSTLQRLRLRVFRDLWARGYFVAFGSKFSADFLIYEAAPSPSCHATAVVVVREFGAPFASVDVVSHCRVAKMVKKQLFFASQQREDDDAEVLYVALNHALLATRQEM